VAVLGMKTRGWQCTRCVYMLTWERDDEFTPAMKMRKLHILTAHATWRSWG
jgi:hypothetical protein